MNEFIHKIVKIDIEKILHTGWLICETTFFLVISHRQVEMSCGFE
jgi:hypothetical protein